MSKDTHFRVGVPAKLSLVVAALLLTPALALANTEDERDKSAQSSSQGAKELQKVADQESDVSEFIKAVEKSGMGDSLTTGNTKYTIFAPTNEAFEDSELKKLMDSGDQQELVEALRAHIVADDVDSEMAGTIGEARTVDGGSVRLSAQGNELKVGEASVVSSDIQQGNLRIHSIDEVLPQSATASMASSGSGRETGSTAGGTGAVSEVDFDELDRNGDGYLSEEELQAQQNLAAQQGQLDSDNDGRVSRTEFAAFEEELSSGRSSTEESGSDLPPHHEGTTDPQPRGRDD